MQKEIDLCFNPTFPYKTIDPSKDVELSIGIKDRTLYIGFLGSVSAKDWIHNFMFWKKPYKQMKRTFFVHAGFLKIYKICRDDILLFVSTRKSEFDSIHISGHSLGAAIATLCYEDMAYLKEIGTVTVPVSCLVTGSPRVFGLLGSRLVKQRCAGIVRLVNGNDIVPKLAPVWMLYTHIVPAIKKGKTSLLPMSSLVYAHDTEAYRGFLDNARVESAENNYLYPIAVKIFKRIYLGIAIVLSLIVFTFIIL
jgi:hypothetical protein